MKKNQVGKKEKIIDAGGRTLGRVASEAAMSLMGKTSASFERNVYCGFPVKVVNASKLKITPKKLSEIYHTRYSGIPGGLRVIKGKETAEKEGLPFFSSIPLIGGLLFGNRTHGSDETELLMAVTFSMTTRARERESFEAFKKRTQKPEAP